MGCRQSAIVESPPIESLPVVELPIHNQHSKATIVHNISDKTIVHNISDKIIVHNTSDKIIVQNTLDKIKERCKLYIHDPKYVYKSCGECIVILKKLETTITNEDRMDIANRKFAAFRANELEQMN